MKTADITMAWRAKLVDHGPTAAVGAIRDALLSAGVNARSDLSKALELLFATLSPDAAKRLAVAIAEDARALRDAHASERSESPQVTALRNKQLALSAKIAELKQKRPEVAERQGRLNALAEDEKRHRDALSQLSSECSRLSAALEYLNRG